MTSEKAWDAMLARLRVRVPEATLKRWFEPLKPQGLNAGRLVLLVPDTQFHYTEKRYGRFLGAIARDVTELDGVVLRRRGLAKGQFSRHVEEDAA